MSSPELPGHAMPEWQLFQPHEQRADGKKTGFTAPDGTSYHLEDDEELVHIKEQDGINRKTYIRKNGVDTPFEDWKQGK